MSKLIFKYGSMSASKTAQLIMDWHKNKVLNGKNIICFKPEQDTRSNEIVSRAIKTKVPAFTIKKNEVGQITKLVKSKGNNISMIYFDEVQFLSKQQIEELAYIVDHFNITVVGYGLITNFKTNMFEGSKRLIEIADVVERIDSECDYCSNEGLFNARFDKDDLIVVDGNEVVIDDIDGKEEDFHYKVLCRSCYGMEINGRQ